jgi:membrane protein
MGRSAGGSPAREDAEGTGPDDAVHDRDAAPGQAGPQPPADRPIAPQPTTAQPPAAQPTTAQPATAQPATAQPATAQTPAVAPAARKGPSRRRRVADYFRDITGGVWRKGAEDDIFFLAGAISFNVLVAFVPLVLAVLGIAGTVLRFQGADAQNALLDYLEQIIPAAVNVDLEPILQELAARGTGILSVGTLFFLWIATRLVGTLRRVLREIFDLAEGRSIVAGKIFDIKMVLAAGTLFALNVLLTLGLRGAAEFVSGVLGIDPAAFPLLGQATQLWPPVVAFITLWVMFLLIYRYLPPRRIGWHTAVVAATFTSLLVELLKYGFSWYVLGVADFGSAWGNIATFVILVFWIYYASVVFILGGEVAQTVSMRRIRRRQRERLT